MSSNDSLKNIVGVALVVCLVCSILVAATAVLLKPKQVANQRLELLRNVLIAGDLLKEDMDVEKVFSEEIEPALIDLKSGDRLPKEKMTGNLAPEKFDVRRASRDPNIAIEVPGDKDRAKIKRMPTRMMVYFVKEKDGYSRVIFPVYGSGLWSVMYGFLALDKDLKTIKGFTIYEHGETPGLGGEVDNPRWKASWKGKLIFDDSGQYIFKVLKGQTAPGATSEIDGLSGATLTTRGVDDMIAFWFGPDGYSPFLEKMKREQGDM